MPFLSVVIETQDPIEKEVMVQSNEQIAGIGIHVVTHDIAFVPIA